MHFITFLTYLDVNTFIWFLITSNSGFYQLKKTARFLTCFSLGLGWSFPVYFCTSKLVWFSPSNTARNKAPSYLDAGFPFTHRCRDPWHSQVIKSGDWRLDLGPTLTSTTLSKWRFSLRLVFVFWEEVPSSWSWVIQGYKHPETQFCFLICVSVYAVHFMWQTVRFLWGKGDKY